MSPLPEAGLRACYRRSILPRAHGFTLLEILIAVSILSIITLTLSVSFSTVLNSVERVDKDQTLLRIADFLVTHLEDSISGAYLPAVGPVGTGVEFIGKNVEDMDGRPLDFLTFYTTAARMGGGALPGDTKRVTYALVEGDDGQYVFTVREKPRLLQPMTGDGGDRPPNEATWAVPMASLDFKYFDGSE